MKYIGTLVRNHHTTWDPAVTQKIKRNFPDYRIFDLGKAFPSMYYNTLGIYTNDDTISPTQQTRFAKALTIKGTNDGDGALFYASFKDLQLALELNSQFIMAHQNSGTWTEITQWAKETNRTIPNAYTKKFLPHQTVSMEF